MNSRRLKLSFRDRRRKTWNYVMLTFMFMLCLTALVPLFAVLYFITKNGIQSINWDFFTQLPVPVGEIGGGIANAIVGSFRVLALGALIGVPIGVGGGLLLSEFRRTRLSTFVRFTSDILLSVPSIIIGLFVYAILVKPFGGFSGYAGSAALAIIIVPIVIRSTEEILKLVPDHIREAGLALGVPRWKVSLQVVLRGSLPGVLTGVMLAISRVAGETAPLLFTAFGNRYWSESFRDPVATLPVQIYNYAISPYEDWHNQAWAASFLLVIFVLIVNLLSRIIITRGTK